MREMNRSTVLNMIYHYDPISRSEISRKTGLNKTTISYLVDELIDSGLVVETGSESSGQPGRNPILLSINKDAGHCIGIHLEVTFLTAVITNLRGEVKFKSERDLDVADMSGDSLTEVLAQEINLIADQAPESSLGVIGAGIALPGIIYSDTGRAELSNYGIADWNIEESVGRQLPFPVYAANDGHCGAIGESLLRHAKDLVFIYLGYGLGGGIILDGQIRKGVRGVAGSFGHTTLYPMGIQCSCGNYGCWEQYASGQALLRYLHDERVADEFQTANRDFFQHAIHTVKNHSEKYERAFKMFGRYLGIGIANIGSSLNPETIVIGGALNEAADFFLPEIISVVERSLSWANQLTNVITARQDAVPIGASALVILNTVLRSPLVNPAYA